MTKRPIHQEDIPVPTTYVPNTATSEWIGQVVRSGRETEKAIIFVETFNTPLSVTLL